MTAAGAARGVTIVGNGVAAFACAKRLATHGVPVALIGPGLPHDRPPMSKRALLTGRLPVLGDAETLAEAGIELVDGIVRAVDLRRRALVVEQRGGTSAERAFAGPLVWATGVHHRAAPVAGGELAHLVATAEGFAAITAQLSARPGQQVAVIGAGLVGAEAAATLATAHEVTLIDVAARPLARLGTLLQELAASALAERGVRFLGGCGIERIVRTGERYGIETAVHGMIAADLVVAAVGTGPTATPEPGAAPGPLELDAECRLPGADRVWACGDCASVLHARYGSIAFPHWDWARQTALHAADSIADGGSSFAAEPYWFSTIGGTHLQGFGVAARATEWEGSGGLHVGRCADGSVGAALLVNAPARMAEAKALLG